MSFSRVSCGLKQLNIIERYNPSVISMIRTFRNTVVVKSLFFRFANKNVSFCGTKGLSF